MSVKIMSEVFERSMTQGNARLVLLSLADSCNDDACCWPSIRKLAQKANVSKPILKKYMNALIEVGVVIRDERSDASGRQTSNLYTINVEKIGSDIITQDVINSVSSPSRVNTFEGVTKVRVGGDNCGYQGVGATVVSLPIMNRHIESSIEPPKAETSAMASDSEDGLVSPKEGTDVDANAESGKSDDLFSRPPSGVKSVIRRERKNSPPTTIPTELDCRDFRDAWTDFLTHRKEKKKPVTPTNERALLSKLREWGASSAAEALRASVMNGWIGVFKPKEEEWRPTTI
jgi:predicted transcriptional regulator